MNFVSLFGRGGWIGRARKFVNDRSKLAALVMQASYYVRRKRSLQEVKDDVVLLGHYVRDVATCRYRGYRTGNLVIIVAVLIYMVSPLDIIPDFLPGGFIDDISIVAWAVKRFTEELSNYRRAELKETTPAHKDASAPETAAPQA